MWLGPDEAGVHQFVLAVKRRMGSNLVQTLDHLEKNTQLFDRFALHKHPMFGRSKDSGMRESRVNVPIALLAIRHMICVSIPSAMLVLFMIQLLHIEAPFPGMSAPHKQHLLE